MGRKTKTLGKTKTLETFSNSICMITYPLGQNGDAYTFHRVKIVVTLEYESLFLLQLLI